MPIEDIYNREMTQTLAFSIVVASPDPAPLSRYFARLNGIDGTVSTTRTGVRESDNIDNLPLHTGFVRNRRRRFETPGE